MWSPWVPAYSTPCTRLQQTPAKPGGLLVSFQPQDISSNTSSWCHRGDLITSLNSTVAGSGALPFPTFVYTWGLLPFLPGPPSKPRCVTAVTQLPPCSRSRGSCFSILGPLRHFHFGFPCLICLDSVVNHLFSTFATVCFLKFGSPGILATLAMDSQEAILCKPGFLANALGESLKSPAQCSADPGWSFP